MTMTANDKSMFGPVFPVVAALLLLAACGDSDGGGEGDGGADPGVVYGDGSTPAAGCGDGVVEGFEECDAGEANSDSAPDACRLDCRLARCGDGVLDGGEACDDGNVLGSDGCSASCQVEEGRFEAEPNDDAASANALEAGVPVRGFVHDGDVDCFAVEVPAAGSWLRASLGASDVACEGAMTITVHHPERGMLATASSTVEAPCPRVGPDTAGELRLVDAGSYRVCVEALLRRGERAYGVVAEVGDGCAGGEWELPVESDVDGDGVDARCDDDDDGDGYLDEVDNCPSVANGGGRPDFGLNGDGWMRHWIGVGFDEESAEECLPLDETRFDPAVATPAAGDRVGEQAWRYVHQGRNQMKLDEAFGGGNDRVAWMVAYVEADAAGPAELRFGSDDGAQVWVNGLETYEVGACRGAQNDQDIVAFDLVEGVNTVAFKIYNGGGGWQLRARLTDAAGEALEGVRLLRDPDPTRVDDQSDRDGDGVGDACDAD